MKVFDLFCGGCERVQRFISICHPADAWWFALVFSGRREALNNWWSYRRNLLSHSGARGLMRSLWQIVKGF